MSAELTGGAVLLIISVVVLAAALMLLAEAIKVARRGHAKGEVRDYTLPRRLWPQAHAVYIDLNGVQPYVLREALYRAGVQVYGVQPPALQADTDRQNRVFVKDGKFSALHEEWVAGPDAPTRPYLPYERESGPRC